MNRNLMPEEPVKPTYKVVIDGTPLHETFKTFNEASQTAMHVEWAADHSLEIWKCVVRLKCR